MVFARTISEPLTSLVKQIDKATAENAGARMGSFVVFLTDDEAMEPKLKQLAKKEGIKKTIICVDNPAGPQGYNIAKEADVTVVLSTEGSVVENHAFRAGELDSDAVERIVSGIRKVLP